MPNDSGEENAQMLVREVCVQGVSSGKSVFDGKCFSTVESGVAGKFVPYSSFYNTDPC